MAVLSTYLTHASFVLVSLHQKRRRSRERTGADGVVTVVWSWPLYSAIYALYALYAPVTVVRGSVVRCAVVVRLSSITTATSDRVRESVDRSREQSVGYW